MKYQHLGMIVVLCSLAHCGLTKPQDGTITVHATVSGEWPTDTLGIRIVAQITTDLYTRKDISEAVIWAENSFIAEHTARGDSTTIVTTFTLPPHEYRIALEEVCRSVYSNEEWWYIGLGRDSRQYITLHDGQKLVLHLSGSFD